MVQLSEPAFADVIEKVAERINKAYGLKLVMVKGKGNPQGWTTATEYDSGSASDVRNDIHFTFHNTESNIEVLFNAEERDVPRKVASVLTGNERDAFWEKLIKQHMLTYDGKEPDQQWYSVIFDLNKRVAPGNSEGSISKLTISLNDSLNPGPDNKRVLDRIKRQEFDSLMDKLSKNDLYYIKDEGTSRVLYVRLRFCCTIPQNQLDGVVELNGMADKIVNKSAPIIEVYKFFNDKLHPNAAT